MGIFFYLVPFHQPISAHAISSHNCHQNVSPPSGALPWMAFLAGSKGQKITILYCFKISCLVAPLIVLFYGVSTLFGSFNAELIVKIVQWNVKKVQWNVKKVLWNVKIVQWNVKKVQWNVKIIKWNVKKVQFQTVRFNTKTLFQC